VPSRDRARNRPSAPTSRHVQTRPLVLTSRRVPAMPAASAQAANAQAMSAAAGVGAGGVAVDARVGKTPPTVPAPALAQIRAQTKDRAKDQQAKGRRAQARAPVPSLPPPQARPQARAGITAVRRRPSKRRARHRCGRPRHRHPVPARTTSTWCGHRFRATFRARVRTIARLG
jgi:hypothetical protein